MADPSSAFDAAPVRDTADKHFDTESERPSEEPSEQLRPTESERETVPKDVAKPEFEKNERETIEEAE